MSNQQNDDFKKSFNKSFNFNDYNLFTKKNGKDIEEKLNKELMSFYISHKEDVVPIGVVNSLTYCNIVVPKIHEMLKNVITLDMIQRRKEISTLMNSFANIYIESVAYLLCFSNRVSPDIVEPKTLTNVYAQYPYLIFNILYKHTIQEQKEIIKIIEKHRYEIQRDVNELELCIQKIKRYWDEREKYPYVLNYFNNLFGMQFKEINQPYSKLPKGKLFVINVGYNYDRTTYLYSNTENIKEDFATFENISNYKSFEKVNIEKRKTRYEIINNGGPENGNYFIVINYCNDSDNKKCKFTFNSSVTYSEKDIKTLKEGGILHPYTRETYALYFSKRFYDQLRFVETSKNFRIVGILSIIKNNYNQDHNTCIHNWSKFTRQDPLLKSYLESLDNCLVNGRLDKNLYIEAMKKYYILE